MSHHGYARHQPQSGGQQPTSTPPPTPTDSETRTDRHSPPMSSSNERIVYPGIPPEYQPLRWRTPQEEIALRLQEIRQVYAGSVHVAYDRFIYHQDCQAIYVRFAACSAPSPRHVDLALGMVAHKISMLLDTLHWRAAPVILDTADVVVGHAAATTWEQTLQALLERVCLVAPAGGMLYAQFNSHRRPDDVSVILDAVRRVQLLAGPDLSQARSATLTSREEAEEIVYMLWTEAEQSYQTVRLAPDPHMPAF